MKRASHKFEKNESQSTVSKRKSTSHHNFYINNCCKNNKFELLLQSLFDIINLEGLFALRYAPVALFTSCYLPSALLILMNITFNNA
jgi:Fe2+ or Zn2+ uptake regulation protein